MRTRQRRLVASVLSAMTILVSGAALANRGGAHARNVCGPRGTAANTSSTDCRACCAGSVQPMGPLTPAEVPLCNAVCDLLYPEEGIAWWVRVLASI